MQNKWKYEILRASEKSEALFRNATLISKTHTAKQGQKLHGGFANEEWLLINKCLHNQE